MLSQMRFSRDTASGQQKAVHRITRPLVAAAAAAIVGFAAHGSAFGIAPSPTPAYLLAESIGQHTGPNDLVVTTGTDDVFLTTPLFARRTTFSVLHHVLNVEQLQSPYIVTAAQGHYGPGRPDKSAVLTVLDHLVDETCARGGRAYLVDSGDASWRGLAAVGVDRNDFTRYDTRPAWQFGGAKVDEVVSASCAGR